MACFGITRTIKTAPTAVIEVLLGLPHCTCNWGLRPEQAFIDSTAVINRNQNLKILYIHTWLRA
jgi:hypothetical protein